jgi:hypothetical protein
MSKADINNKLLDLFLYGISKFMSIFEKYPIRFSSNFFFKKNLKN